MSISAPMPIMAKMIDLDLSRYGSIANNDNNVTRKRRALLDGRRASTKTSGALNFASTSIGLSTSQVAPLTRSSLLT